MGFITFFIDRSNPWLHWTWVLYFSLVIALLLLEYHDHKAKRKSPLERAKEYLKDCSGWKISGAENYEEYYEAAPEFRIRTNDKDNHLDFTQEWTRGEIGRHYNTGNAAYYREIYFYGTLLHQIHIVIFDGGKKTIVAPDWEAIGTGRIYYYLKDGIKYAYQEFLIKQCGKDHSRDIRKSNACGTLDIVVFADKKELQKFITLCGECQSDDSEADEEKQNSIFYELLEKYQTFRQKCR